MLLLLKKMGGGGETPATTVPTALHYAIVDYSDSRGASKVMFCQNNVDELLLLGSDSM